MLAYCQYLPLHIFILGFRLSVATRCEVVEVVPSLNPVRNFDPQSAQKKIEGSILSKIHSKQK